MVLVKEEGEEDGGEGDVFSGIEILKNLDRIDFLRTVFALIAG